MCVIFFSQERVCYEKCQALEDNVDKNLFTYDKINTKDVLSDMNKNKKEKKERDVSGSIIDSCV